jgi:hypothetical protein
MNILLNTLGDPIWPAQVLTTFCCAIAGGLMPTRGDIT